MLVEIAHKSHLCALDSLNIGAIFVGGGTPSLLSADEIRRFGAALRAHFDLSHLREFSFECEVKSVSLDKVLALRDIGVTNARFGLQTFNPFWRNMFALTATVDQIHEAVRLFRAHVSRTSFDILYAMNGHTQDQFEADLRSAVALDTTLVDVYPLDNVVTQLELHSRTRAAGLPPLTATQRFSMNASLRDYMREHGFLPHNGHGYVRSSSDEIRANPVVTPRYTFEYHKHVYGIAGYDVIGFGVNAVSILRGQTHTNHPNRGGYIKRLMEERHIDVRVSRHSNAIDTSRAVVAHLPYHGYVRKSDVHWDQLPLETAQALHDFLESGLATEVDDQYRLTLSGWHWYVNMMYYALPRSQKAALDAFIVRQLRQKGRELTLEQVVF
jgi:oxygen-independent coproporphyrinogen-3 oxidase